MTKLDQSEVDRMLERANDIERRAELFDITKDERARMYERAEQIRERALGVYSSPDDQKRKCFATIKKVNTYFPKEQKTGV